MSNNNIEVEIKVSVDEDTFLEVKERLNDVAKFVKNSHQTDEYFTPAHRNFVKPKSPFEWLSIRRRGDKTILNYKHWHPENAEVRTHCDEFETEIKDPDQLNRLFSILDFKKLVTVEKDRETYMYNDEFEIALDTVKGLGNFIEIESIKDFGGVEETRKKIFEVAKKLGIDTSKVNERGYPYLLMKKKELIK
jgi:adenylate cyclase class 2